MSTSSPRPQFSFLEIESRRAPVPDYEWFEHPDYQEHVETLFADCPDSWDGDDGQEAILENWVAHMASEVRRLGGCLNRGCAWDNDEPCDHGYLAMPTVKPRPSCTVFAGCEKRVNAEHRAVVSVPTQEGPKETT